MNQENPYSKELNSEMINRNAHRGFVGGMWEQLGKFQLDYMISNGLKPHHKLIDIGCGCLRGGVHFIDYLDSGNYFGTDINQSLMIVAGNEEIKKAGITQKKPNLSLTSDFIGEASVKYDFALAFSLFTHLKIESISRCLRNLRPVLSGSFFATFFDKNDKPDLTTHGDRDPYHYDFYKIKGLAENVGFSVKVDNTFEHPRKQKMVVFK